ncbi:MAG: hypothetical protein U0531_00785 [Dehalococcoidia bacterium]
MQRSTPSAIPGVSVEVTPSGQHYVVAPPKNLFDRTCTPTAGRSRSVGWWTPLRLRYADLLALPAADRSRRCNASTTWWAVT